MRAQFHMADRRMTAVRADESVSQITVEGIKKRNLVKTFRNMEVCNLICFLFLRSVANMKLFNRIPHYASCTTTINLCVLSNVIPFPERKHLTATWSDTEQMTSVNS